MCVSLVLTKEHRIIIECFCLIICVPSSLQFATSGICMGSRAAYSLLKPSRLCASLNHRSHTWKPQSSAQMARYLLSPSFLSAFVTILVAIVGTELWLPRYGLTRVGLRIQIRISDGKQDLYDKDFSCPVGDAKPALKCGDDCCGSGALG